METVCQNCRWWKRVYKQNGSCRRYPPTVQQDEADCFPVTAEADWCGEWTYPTVQQMNERAKASEDTTTAEA